MLYKSKSATLLVQLCLLSLPGLTHHSITHANQALLTYKHIPIIKSAQATSEFFNKEFFEFYKDQNPHDALIKAILNNNLQAVQKSKQPLNKKITVEFYAVLSSTSEPMYHRITNSNYLQLAMEKFLISRDKTTYEIIKELLNKGINPAITVTHTWRKKNEQTGKWSEFTWSEIPAHRALKAPRLLKLLLKNGLCVTPDLLEAIKNESSLPKQVKITLACIAEQYKLLQQKEKNCKF